IKSKRFVAATTKTACPLDSIPSISSSSCAVTSWLMQSAYCPRGGQTASSSLILIIIIIIAVPVVPMTVVAPVPVPVRTIIVVVGAIVVRIVATVVHRIRVAIRRADRYAKVTVSLGFLGHESDEPKRQQNQEKIFFHEINLLIL